MSHIFGGNKVGQKIFSNKKNTKHDKKKIDICSKQILTLIYEYIIKDLRSFRPAVKLLRLADQRPA